MRIIPKRTKVKNTVWKCYSMPDILMALVMFAIIFIAITKGNWVFAGILGICSVILFMPTQDGIFYACILENVKFLFERKRYTAEADKPKENINVLLGLKAIKENGINDGSLTINLDALTNDTLCFRYTASGNFADTWYNSDCMIIVESLNK